jgi:hypothetical protein
MPKLSSAANQARRFSQLLQGRAAVLAGFARGNADLQDLPLGKQAQGSAGGQHLAPVEMRARHGVRAALGVTLRPGHLPDGIGRFLHQQRLVAVQRVQALQPALQVGRELGGGDLHQYPQESRHAPQEFPKRGTPRKRLCRAAGVVPPMGGRRGSDSGGLFITLSPPPGGA